jgi:NTE family protein
MQKALISLVFVVLSAPALCQPKIGLTLSGGGAKGLAHIGILEAIDSAGLRVDCITGTSMGSIVGSLYAVGYTGKEIEKIARDMDWSVLFSGKPSMQNVNIEEKNEFSNYAIEIPYQDGKFKIASGFIEGQELWLKFQEFFLPIYDIKDFTKFSIPFKCVATDVGTGKPVVLDQGELVTAIRSSMAIPSFFTPIDYKDTKLVDGGVVRNFPVQDVRNMGADYIIGVNLSQGLSAAKDLNSAIDILYQIGFYKDADDFDFEKSLCDVLIEPNVADYSAAAFGSADSLLAIGKAMGIKYYPVFKRMADSLRSIYPDYKPMEIRLPKTRTVTLDSIIVTGLSHTTRTSFINRLDLPLGESYDGTQVAQAIRRVYGSQNYSRIAYSWEPNTQPGHANINFNIIERPLTYVKAGIHYHTFSGIALILAAESKNLLFDRSKSTVKVNISENFRALVEHNQTFGKRDNANLIASLYFETFVFPWVIDYEKQYLYRTKTFDADVRLQRSFGFSTAMGLGTMLESFRFVPRITSGLSARGTNTYFHSYAYVQHNTLNKRNFATRGSKLEGRIGVVYDQNPTALKVTDGTVSAEIDTVLGAYMQIALKMEHYSPLSSKLTLMAQFNTAFNYSAEDAYFNFFPVGGLNDFLRNQITFVGLPEYSIATHSAGTATIGLQYAITKNIFATIRASAGIYDFVGANKEFDFSNHLAGGGISLGYDSGIGPISVTTMYSGQSDKVYAYVNIGFPFNR